MAIDTENKRRSVQAYGGAIVYPVADGAITAPDREHSTWFYAGVSAGAPSAGPFFYGRHAKRQGPQRKVITS